MASTEPIICRPTNWFRFRAGAIFLMFGVFALLFYLDGSSGYRQDNAAYYIYKTFKPASEKFAKMNEGGNLNHEQWREFASTQKVKFPQDRSILPADIELPMAWPEVLQDFAKMESLQWKALWIEYSKIHGYEAEPPEKAHDAKSIRDQWIVFYTCSVLSALSLFFLLRTSWRNISATDEGIISQDGRKVPYSAMKRLDLRKWKNKGLAIVGYEDDSGPRRLRIDGLTYGGFKKDQNQPAERLMERIRMNFSGELLEYTTVEEKDEPNADSASDGKSE